MVLHIEPRATLCYMAGGVFEWFASERSQEIGRIEATDSGEVLSVDVITGVDQQAIRVAGTRLTSTEATDLAMLLVRASSAI